MEEKGAEQDKGFWVRVTSHLHSSVGPNSWDRLAGQKPAGPAPLSEETVPSFWCQCPALVPRFKTSGRELLQKEKARANDFWRNSLAARLEARCQIDWEVTT